jgi:hypothetical protein
MNWVEMLPKLAGYGVGQITLRVTEKTARMRLGIKRPTPLLWNGIPLNCVGSSRWRNKVWGCRNLPPISEKSRCEGCGLKREEDSTIAICRKCLALVTVPKRTEDTSSAEPTK